MFGTFVLLTKRFMTRTTFRGSYNVPVYVHITGWQLIINGNKQDSIVFSSAFIGNTLQGKLDTDNVTVTINNKIIFYNSELFINGNVVRPIFYLSKRIIHSSVLNSNNPFLYWIFTYYDEYLNKCPYT